MRLTGKVLPRWLGWIVRGTILVSIFSYAGWYYFSCYYRPAALRSGQNLVEAVYAYKKETGTWPKTKDDLRQFRPVLSRGLQGSLTGMWRYKPWGKEPGENGFRLVHVHLSLEYLIILNADGSCKRLYHSRGLKRPGEAVQGTVPRPASPKTVEKGDDETREELKDGDK